MKKLKGYDKHMKVYLRENDTLTPLSLSDIGWSSKTFLVEKIEENELPQALFLQYDDLDEMNIAFVDGEFLTGYHHYDVNCFIENDCIILEKTTERD